MGRTFHPTYCRTSCISMGCRHLPVLSTHCLSSSLHCPQAMYPFLSSKPSLQLSIKYGRGMTESTPTPKTWNKNESIERDNARKKVPEAKPLRKIETSDIGDQCKRRRKTWQPQRPWTTIRSLVQTATAIRSMRASSRTAFNKNKRRMKLPIKKSVYSMILKKRIQICGAKLHYDNAALAAAVVV